MGWSIGFDDRWARDIGYAVPAYCDFPGCGKTIDRGLSYVCGAEPYGGDHGCGLFFCGEHLFANRQRCSRCHNHRPPFKPTADHPAWVAFKLLDPSWDEWRAEHPEFVAANEVLNDALHEAMEHVLAVSGAGRRT
jgi:hypothetical protein